MNDVRQKDFRDGDGEDRSGELFEDTFDGADSYLIRYAKLGQRAAKHGFSVFTVISWHDPLSGYSASRVISTGNYYQNLGAARSALTAKENEG